MQGIEADTPVVDAAARRVERHLLHPCTAHSAPSGVPHTKEGPHRLTGGALHIQSNWLT